MEPVVTIHLPDVDTSNAIDSAPGFEHTRGEAVLALVVGFVVA